MRDQAIGEQIIHAIVDGGLLSSSCPDVPDAAVMHVWRENAAEQIGRVAIDATREHLSTENQQCSQP